MTTFTINADNNITALAGLPVGDDPQAFSTAKELAKLTTEWPAARLVELWNSFAGVAPFDELKPVKKFTDRKAAVARIWKAVQRLAGPDANDAPQAATDAPKKVRAKKPAAKVKGSDKARTGGKDKREAGGKKAEVIALMTRAKGVTLGEIAELTGWQKHTIRGFVSILGSKGGIKVESSKNAAGDRSYHIAK